MKKCENPNCENIVTKLNKKKEIRRYCSISCCNKHRGGSTMAKAKLTLMNRYGVDHPSKIPEVQEKIKQTCLERHGTEHFLQSIGAREKIKKTNLEKLGVENPFQSLEIQEQMKKTNLKNLGVEYAGQSLIVQEKRKQSSLLKNGTTAYANKHISLETQNKLNDAEWLYNENQTKTILQIATELNVAPSTVQKRFKKFKTPVKYHPRSFFEIQVYDFISAIHQAIPNDRTQIKPYELDIYLPDLNLAFECNGEPFHKNPEREKNKIKMAKNVGIELHLIWFNDWKNNKEQTVTKIQQIIENKIKQFSL